MCSESVTKKLYECKDYWVEFDDGMYSLCIRFDKEARYKNFRPERVTQVVTPDQFKVMQENLKKFFDMRFTTWGDYTLTFGRRYQSKLIVKTLLYNLNEKHPSYFGPTSSIMCESHKIRWHSDNNDIVMRVSFYYDYICTLHGCEEVVDIRYNEIVDRLVCELRHFYNTLFDNGFTTQTNDQKCLSIDIKGNVMLVECITM
jgi:hypothetical protein